MSTRDKHQRPWTQTAMPEAVLHPPAPEAPASDQLVRVASSLDELLPDATPTADTTAAAAQRLHARQAKAAHASGVVGESWVDRHHYVARYSKRPIVAKVWHTGEPSVPHIVRGQLARDRRQRVLKAVVGVAPPDYVILFTSGLFGAVEVKRRAGRLSRDRRRADGTEDRDAIDVHQAEDLALIATTQALSLVVVEFVRAREDVRVAVPWSVLSTRWRSPRGGALSAGPEDLEDYRVTGDCYLERFVR